MSSKQYIVFSAIGKTTWCKSHLNWVDIDIGWYNPVTDTHAVSNMLYFYPRWDYNILIAGTAEALQMIIAHQHNFKNLLRPNYIPLKINIILPSKEMKDEMIARIAGRGCAGDTKYLTSVYDKNWTALDQAKFDTKVYLKPGQYLSDILDDDGNYKEGVEVIYPNE